MKELIVKTQSQLDKIKADFEGTVYIEGGTEAKPLNFTRNLESAEVIVRGQAWLVMGGSAVVQSMWGNATVQSMWDSAVVQRMGGNATVQRMGGNATVQRMGGNATVQSMWGNATVQRMGGNATVQSMWGNAKALELFGEAMVGMAGGGNIIVCKGYNLVRTTARNKKNLTLTMSKESNLVIIPDFEPTKEEYLKRYPVTKKGKKVILYKAVHKDGDIYRSDWNRSFTYEIGKKVTHDNAPQINGACSYGLHVSHKDWAIRFGLGWKDMALLECEVPLDKIVVAGDCDGKVRTSELKVLREVPQEEWYAS